MKDPTQIGAIATRTDIGHRRSQCSRRSVCCFPESDWARIKRGTFYFGLCLLLLFSLS